MSIQVVPNVSGSVTEPGSSCWHTASQNAETLEIFSRERTYWKGSPVRRPKNKSHRPRARGIDGIKKSRGVWGMGSLGSLRKGDWKKVQYLSLGAGATKLKAPTRSKGHLVNTRHAHLKRLWSYPVLTNSAQIICHWLQAFGKLLRQTSYCLGHVLLEDMQILKQPWLVQAGEIDLTNHYAWFQFHLPVFNCTMVRKRQAFSRNHSWCFGLFCASDRPFDIFWRCWAAAMSHSS